MTQARPHLIDEFDDLDTHEFDSTGLDRDGREALIEGGYQVLREHGYPIPLRYIPICKAFIEGTIDFNELSRRIMAPDLN
jgi:hypothetical protein